MNSLLFSVIINLKAFKKITAWDINAAKEGMLYETI